MNAIKWRREQSVVSNGCQNKSLKSNTKRKQKMPRKAKTSCLQAKPYAYYEHIYILICLNAHIVCNGYNESEVRQFL